MAAVKGHLNVVHYLLRQGASHDALNRFGDTPSFDAAERGNPTVIQALIHDLRGPLNGII
ncbi:hypothetical protein BGW36DRAFT_366478 [Talaromyces proteolyticus]|uniref:Ankyrin repeat protein n=1 Tax=Talaromyces proteolyticus TaxID=1131652 RepID=A0AAD4Q5T2_9EURO|nr:uncharacterized protein BGW36DRAFT_366478 [Talaromyces proteolyticus]KAH8704936.1 hypothetical protein BGW36DRAFT_366478 [Talaromyces proteolyticus]